MKRALLFCLGIGLAGCASTPRISDEDACVSYGAQSGTQEYFQCRMANDQQRQANNAALAGAILSHQQPYYLPMPQPLH